MTKTTEMFGRYEIKIEGPDPLSNNRWWGWVRSTKAKMGRTVNNKCWLEETREAVEAKVSAFKASKQ